MKQFKRRLSDIEIQIEAVDGRMIDLKSIIQFNADDMNSIESMVDKDDKSGDKIVNQMTYIFGKDKTFWLQFDFSILADVLSYVSEQLYTKKKG